MLSEIANVFTGSKRQAIRSRKNWDPVLSDLREKLSKHRAELDESVKERGELAILAEGGDTAAMADLQKVSTKVGSIRERIDHLENALETAKQEHKRAEAELDAEAEHRRRAAIKRALKDLRDAAAAVDRSFETLGQRIPKLQSASDELLALTGRSDIQLVEHIYGPRKNVSRFLASHLPMHSGFEKMDDKPRKLADLLPSEEQIMEMVK
ncbi:MAG: hypothetical protein ABW149_00030 [Sedimenticola sp.]